jgi:hypothetical protein
MASGPGSAIPSAVVPVAAPLVDAPSTVAMDAIPASAPQSPAASAMRDALGQMGAAISQSRAATAKAVALASPVSQVETARHTVPTVEAPPFDGDPGYDPLHEVAEEAGLALLRGRPVTILLLGVGEGGLTVGPAKALEMILAERGATIALSIDPASVTAEGIRAAARSLADTHSFVLVNGGATGANARSLAKAATFTLLVAAEDLEDERVELATRDLDGCDYFIINTVPEPAAPRVRL